MTVCVRIFPFNAAGKGEKDRFRALKLISTQLKCEQRAHSGQQFDAVYRAGQEVIRSGSNSFYAIVFVGESRD